MITAPLPCAKNRPLTELAPGPDLRQAVVGWCRPMTLEITRLVAGAGGDAEKIVRQVPADAFLRPGKPQELKIKLEGTRQWKFWTMYTLQDTGIQVGDVARISGRPFKAMGSWDYSQFGYFKLAMVEDFR